MNNVLKNTLELAPYNKVVGWCRSIEKMKLYYKYIKRKFPNLDIYCSSFCDESLSKHGYNVEWSEFGKKSLIC